MEALKKRICQWSTNEYIPGRTIRMWVDHKRGPQTDLNTTKKLNARWGMMYSQVHFGVPKCATYFVQVDAIDVP